VEKEDLVVVELVVVEMVVVEMVVEGVEQMVEVVQMVEVAMVVAEHLYSTSFLSECQMWGLDHMFPYQSEAKLQQIIGYTKECYYS